MYHYGDNRRYFDVDAAVAIGKKEPRRSKLVDDFFSGALRFQQNGQQVRTRKKPYEQALEDMLSAESARPALSRREWMWYDEWNRNWAGSKHGDKHPSQRPRPLIADQSLPSAQGIPIAPSVYNLPPQLIPVRW